MLNRDFGFKDTRLAFSWDDLKEAAPTVMAFALVCSRAILEPTPWDEDSLSAEAKALLVAAKKRGVFELKGDWEAFDSSERLLSVSVEVDDQVHWLFKRVGDSEQTMRFLAGFLQLCRCGLVMHQWQREFIFSAAGFEAARQMDASQLEQLLDFPQKTDHDQWSAGN